MPITRFHSAATRLPRHVKKRILAAVDFTLLSFAVWASLSLATNRPYQPDTEALLILALVPAVGTCLFRIVGLHDAVIRYVGVQVIYSSAKGATAAAALMLLLGPFAQAVTMPLAAPIMLWLITFCLLGGSRFTMRNLLQAGIRPRDRKENVVIYGAGAAGVELASALGQGRNHRTVAFLDDDTGLHGSEINGLPVYSPAALETLIRENSVRQVLLAMPSATRSKRKQLLERLENLTVRVRTIPPLGTIVSGQAPLDELRDIDVEDLLGRDTVPPDATLLDACIRDKAVLVTGAGGSIGSELCRQIIRRRPARLVLFDVSEFSLYRIDAELRGYMARREQAEVEVIPILGSVTDAERIASTIRNNGIDTIYHAAAYKHVPLVETNMIEGVRNNVFGTWNAARAAVTAGVENFVLVSTDKAVRPTNVMGATKRVAELVLQGLNQALTDGHAGDPALRPPTERPRRTVFSMVRFGNVLGSSGSVVPLFREQIRRGRPVTVTHPEITRFFMTIPEAAELVLQAGALSRGGDVFLLDMGEPVKIVDLARRMIRLMGCQARDEHNQDGDIEICYTGLRPGEKLHEELLIDDTAQPTRHSMIMRAEELSLPWPQVRALLGSLEEATNAYDCVRTRQLLAEVVHGYRGHGALATDFANGVLSGSNETIATLVEGETSESRTVTPIRRVKTS